MTPLGQKLADPLSIQAFETSQVNANAVLLENAIAANGSALALLVTQAFNSKVRARASRASAAITAGTGRTNVTMTDIDTAFSRTDVGSWSITSGGLVVPKTMEYLVRLRTQWPGDSGTTLATVGGRLMSAFVNGNEWANGLTDTKVGLPSISTYMTCWETIQLTAGQRIQPAIAHTSSTNTWTATGIDVTLWGLGLT